MKIWRFNTGHSRLFIDDWVEERHHSYAYVRFSWFERLFFRKRILALVARHQPQMNRYPNAPGPKRYGAQFILSPKPVTRDRHIRRHLEKSVKNYRPQVSCTKQTQSA